MSGVCVCVCVYGNLPAFVQRVPLALILFCFGTSTCLFCVRRHDVCVCVRVCVCVCLCVLRVRVRVVRNVRVSVRVFLFTHPSPAYHPHTTT